MLPTLLFIIFGRKIKDKNYGRAYLTHCLHCDNSVYYDVCKWRSWAHIFWIPVIPWFSNKQLVCPICNAGYELDRKEFKKAKELVDKEKQYNDRELTDEEFLQVIREFEKDMSFVSEPIDVDSILNKEETAELPDKEEETDEQNPRKIDHGRE